MRPAVELVDGEGFLRNLPNVAAVHQDRMWHPWLDTATNGVHHGGDAANLKTVNGVFVKGRNNTIAIIDTGMDANAGGQGRPHRAFFPNGDITQNGGGINGSYLRGQFDASGSWGTEDQNGHGTFVAGCAAANKWIPTNNSSDYGFAPEAHLYNINISSAANGGAQGAAVLAAWNHIANVRVAQNITVANNSYSGSPDMTDPVQQALDSLVYNGNVLVCVAAGNSDTDTSRSQSAYNGLSVGSIEKGTLQVSSFSCKGPLNGSQRTYPDIAAVGQRVNSLAIDNEGVVNTSDGNVVRFSDGGGRSSPGAPSAPEPHCRAGEGDPAQHDDADGQPQSVWRRPDAGRQRGRCRAEHRGDHDSPHQRRAPPPHSNHHPRHCGEHHGDVVAGPERPA
jgi:hypothetical protein